MAKGKSNARRDPGTLNSPKTLDAPPKARTGFFPFARYTSVVGVHMTLLTFTALFLPRTTFFFELTRPSVDPELQTSRDRPQHPFLEELTLSPVSTLFCLCAGVFILQGWWGGWMRTWWTEYALEGTDVEKKLEKVAADRHKMTELGRAWIATLLASFAFHLVLVLFGAPSTSYILHTYLLALLISLLVVFSPAYSLGPPSLSSDTQALVNRITWVRLFAEFSIRTPVERAFVYPAIGTFLGSWVGAIPIALDWDRPWQAWPLTPAFGAILGYICASLIALTANATIYLAEEHIRSLDAGKKTI
ncbi:putative GPI biosynthesis protein family Pig-F [Lyophyllum shimeji]|uniref:GPI biosynthesis protein family Pig-F n=1 Tax=Lyophyllum shimeji TaxID=47721 RepID=A0A9P3PQN5_LYOSH|nr:putative GPI biosynthesis protein family Pig-F [Lyophyllum shimeji]